MQYCGFPNLPYKFGRQDGRFRTGTVGAGSTPPGRREGV